MKRIPWWRWLLWAALMAGVTLLLFRFRSQLDKAHVALIYLLVVLAGTIAGDRALGFALAGTAFLLFDWFFLPPYNTLDVNDPLDWLVLLAFLTVSTVVAQILHRLRREVETKEQRAIEVDQFAALGAEALNVARADHALADVAEVIRTTLGLATCSIHRPPLPAGAGPGDPDQLITWVLDNGRVAIRHADGTTRLAGSAELPNALVETARSLFLPLVVRGRTVGVLELGAATTIGMTAPQRRFLAALAHYAALGVERARLEEEAARVEAFRQADRLKDALLASVSHDLRTPLTTIKALAHELIEIDDRAIAIEEEADHLNRVVANLLDLTRLKAGAFSPALEINAVDDLIGALLQQVSGGLKDREVRVHLEDGGTLLVGRFDLAQSLRVLINLVDNAHKYAPPGAPITVTAQLAGDNVEIAVADQGPGVSPLEVERIFEPFYRAPGLAPDVGGTGLGLAISRQLARAQGGDIRYRPAPSGGSVFTLTFPAAQLPPATL